MRIAEPSNFLLLWIVPALAVFYLWSFRRRAELLKRFASSEMLTRLVPSISRRRQRFKAALMTTAVVFALLALLRPQWGFKWEEITREGVDIMVAVDVSQSMMAEDVKPNRLERAKRELQDLLGKLEGDRIGLIAFAGTAFVQCPLTLDYGAFQMFLDYLEPDLIPIPGTSITDAIRLAQKSFTEQTSTSRALILITDGEDHEGQPLEAAKEAKEAGIKIYAIGIGATEGAPIPSPNGDGFIKDRRGQLEMTRIDEDTLQRIAIETGGAYVRSTTGDFDLDQIYAQGIKQSLEATELKSSRQKRWEERFQWPLFATIFLILLESLVSERGRRRGLLIALVFIPLLASTQTAQAGLLGDTTIQEGVQAYQKEDYETALQKFTDAKIEHPDDPLLDYNLGNTYYRTRRFEDAETSYQKVVQRSPDPKLKAQALYNLGNTAYRQGKLDKAVEFYQEALKLDPSDLDAKRNLERTRAEIQRRLEEMQKQQEQQQQQQQQQGSEGEDNEGQNGQASSNQQGEQQQQASEQEGEDKQQSPESEKEKAAQAEEQSERGAPEEETSPTPDEQGQARGAGENQEGEKNEEGQQALAGQEKEDGTGEPEEASQGRLTREEAQRLLDQVKDQQQAGMRAPNRRGRSAPRPPGGKPW